MTGANAEHFRFIRPAKAEDWPRIAEILVFNYRLSFYPIFQNDWFYFDHLQVPNLVAQYQQQDCLKSFFVYDDGTVKGFTQITGQEVAKLFVEPVLQGRGIGAALLNYAIAEHGVRFLWALEKNTKAIAFYERHGFHATGEKKPENDTAEYLVRLER